MTSPFPLPVPPPPGEGTRMHRHLVGGDEAASASRNCLGRMIIRYRSYAPAWERKPETLQRLVRRTPGHPKLRKAPSPQPLLARRSASARRPGGRGNVDRANAYFALQSRPAALANAPLRTERAVLHLMTETIPHLFKLLFSLPRANTQKPLTLFPHFCHIASLLFQYGGAVQ